MSCAIEHRYRNKHLREVINKAKAYNYPVTVIVSLKDKGFKSNPEINQLKLVNF